MIGHLGEVSALAAAAVWAAAVILYRRSGNAASPVALNLFKNTIGLLLFVPTMWLTGSLHWPAWDVHDWLVVAASGVIGIAVGDTLFFAALNRIGAGMWAIVDCLYSPLVILFAFLLLGEHLTAIQMAGGALVLAAVLLPSLGHVQVASTRRFMTGIGLGVLAAAAMAIGAVLTKRVLMRSDVVFYTTARLALGMAPLLVMLVRRSWRRELAATFAPSREWVFSLPASFCGAYLGLLLWIAGLKFTLVGLATLLNQMSAVLVLLFAHAFLNEPLTARKVLSIGLACGGMILLVWQ